MVYSYSRLRCFRRCPLSYRFQYIDKVEVPEFETIESFMGSRVHETLDLFYGEISKGKAPGLEDLLTSYAVLWDKYMSPAVVVNKPCASVEDFRLAGAKCLEDYYLAYEPFDKTRVIATEFKVKIDLLGDGRYDFIGYIDRLDADSDGAYEIHDYKTSRALPSRKGKDGGEQLALYELGVRQNIGDVREVEHVWHYLRHNREIRSKKTHDDLETLKESLISAVDQIEKAAAEDDFPAMRTNLCGWCAYQEICSQERHAKRPRQTTLSGYIR